MELIGTDVSFWQDDNATPRRIDFAKMKAAGARFVFIRVGQNEWIDPDFVYNWSESKKQGFKRGAYWFYDSRKDPIFQADLFVDTVGADKPEMFYVFDLEESYGGPFAGFSNWKKHIDRLEARVGASMLMGYSRATYIDEHNLLSEQIAYLRRFQWWMAHYGVLIPWVPRGWGANEYLFHQYTDKGDGFLYGAESTHIDLNRFNGDEAAFVSRFGGTVTQPPIVDEIYYTHAGVTVHKIVRFGCPVFVHIIDPKKAKTWVTGLENKFRTVVQTADRYSAAVVTNGGGWPYNDPTWTNEVWKSKGILLKATAKDNRPWVGFTQNGEVVFGQGVPASDVLDVVGYDRYLGQNGVFNSRYLYDTVKDARTFSGRTRDGKFVLCVAEGDDYDQYGLTFKEEWDVLAEFNCDIGGNHDGGSSSGVVNKVLGSGSLTKPSDPELAYVINSIVVNSGEAISLNEYRKLIGYNKGIQGDLNQTGICRTFNDCSGAQWLVTLSPADLALLWKVNGITSQDDPKWRWACGVGFFGKAYYKATETSPVQWPYVVICSAIDGSKINQVHVTGYDRGFYTIELIPTNFGNISPSTHPWLFHRCIAQNSDTPQGIFWMPLFSPVGRIHSTGSEGALLQEFYVDGKITPEVPVSVPFTTKVTGVPGLLGPKPLNIRESATMFNPGKIGFFNVGAPVEVLEVVSNVEGKFGRVTSKYWICLYNAVKKQWYVDWRG